jgi:hypothetical protein
MDMDDLSLSCRPLALTADADEIMPMLEKLPTVKVLAADTCTKLLGALKAIESELQCDLQEVCLALDEAASLINASTPVKTTAPNLSHSLSEEKLTSLVSAASGTEHDDEI